MEQKHTPGPWVVCVDDEDDRGFTIFAEAQIKNGVIHADDWDCHVASAGLNCQNFEANARLIAAAPEMLEALRLAEMAMLGYLHRNEVIDSALAAARTVITKATGDAP